MPPIFKALATVAIWILFINGCIGIVGSGVSRLFMGEAAGPLIAWMIAVASLFLAVAAMKLRQMLE